MHVLGVVRVAQAGDDAGVNLVEAQGAATLLRDEGLREGLVGEGRQVGTAHRAPCLGVAHEHRLAGG